MLKFVQNFKTSLLVLLYINYIEANLRTFKLLKTSMYLPLNLNPFVYKVFQTYTIVNGYDLIQSHTLRIKKTY